MSKASEQMRSEWSQNDAKRDAGLKTPENINRIDDIQYGPDPVFHKLDIYRLKNASGKAPVIVIVHGGGWVYGDKELYQHYGMSLAQRGFTVVNYTYRLAPEKKFPSSLEDTNSVIAWMSEHAVEYEFDMNQVCMVGDSAGAHMLGLYSGICTVPEYAAKFPFEVPHGFIPRAIGLNCGVYKLFTGENKGADDNTMELIEDLMPSSGIFHDKSLINVIDLVNEKFPPAFITSAVGDFLVEQVPILEEAYKKMGAYCESKIYGDKKTPLYHVFHVTIQEPLGQQCNDEECDFFKRIIAKN